MKMFFSNRRKGIALVITLSAVVLMTVVVLAFFSRAQLNRKVSFSSTNQIKADFLAKSALDIVKGEIRQEVADAVATTNPNDGMVLGKSGVVGPDATTGTYTIYKVAANGSPFRTGGANVASTVSLSDKAINGKQKSDWFDRGPSLGSASLPTWVYMTRGNGAKIPALASSKDTSSPDFVVGRYSYTVYETGGMLDANVAGYPTTTPFATAAVNIGAKGSTAYADLTALGLTTEMVDKLVSWRNGSLAISTATQAEKAKVYDEWATGIPRTVGTPNAAALKAAHGGHLELAAGDNAFLGRGELIRFAGDKGMPATVVQSLSHFSRSMNSYPSWGPSNVTGSSIAYGDMANDSGSANRYLPNVFAFAMNVRYYHDDGTYEDAEISADDPLVDHRFSLAKLAWLGHNGPNKAAFNSSLSDADRERAIKTCFGLEWNNSRKRWDYGHGVDGVILTMEQVKAQKRQPDFFELLKEGILSGSLGGEPGRIAGEIDSSDVTSGTDTNEGPIGRYFDKYSKDKDRHIMQIGANIIDQADADNFPTALYLRKSEFDTLSLSPTEKEFNATFFGLENLPMLQRVGNICLMSATPNPSGPMEAWLQPEVWNPNDKSTAGTGLTDPNYPTPAALRLVTYGSSLLYNEEELISGDLTNFGEDYYNPSVDGTICFKNPGPNSTAPINFFDIPIPIKGFEKATIARKYDDATCASGPKNRYPLGTTAVSTSVNNNQYLGVYLGSVSVNPDLKNGGKGGHTVSFVPSARLSFVLEYYDGSSWRPYSSINRIEQLIGSSRSSSGKKGDAFWIGGNGAVDPRTTRFSGSAGRVGTGSNVGWKPGNSVRPTANTILTLGSDGRSPVMQAWPRKNSGFVHFPTSSGYYLFDTWMKNTESTSDSYYKDPDGVTRPGDGLRGMYSTGDGIMALAATELTESATRRRPVILNRPFRSVGELGYAFRDQPFKTLDFWSDKSADAGLLSLFSASEQYAPVSAGLVNPNAAPPKVLEAILTGAAKQAGDPNKIISATESKAVAAAIASNITANGPLSEPAQLVTRVGNDINAAMSAPTSHNKTYGETPVRALSANMNNRVLNLLVDVIAQSGTVAKQGTGLKDFSVQGEKRYWLHLAVDRITGDVLDSQLEPCYE